jgi:hypothetical protein
MTNPASAAIYRVGAMPMTASPMPITLITLNETVPINFLDGLGRTPASRVPTSAPPPNKDMIQPNAAAPSGNLVRATTGMPTANGPLINMLSPSVMGKTIFSTSSCQT